LKRKSSKTELSSSKKSKKSKVQDATETVGGTPTTTPLLSRKELRMKTGLSDYMINVAMDLLDNSAPLVLIDIVYPNVDIVSLNKDVVDAHRPECAQQKRKKSKKSKEDGGGESQSQAPQKKSKTYTDDEVRKHIVEKRERELASTGVRLAGSTQHEKMDNANKDMTLVSEFLGFARTSRGYFVYAYYVGPDVNRAAELRNPRNWIIVNKGHLSVFHKRLRDLKPYRQETGYGQASFGVSGALNETPAFDPRFIMVKWLSKEGSGHKELLKQHKSLYNEEDSDFLVKHYKSEASNALHYYEEGKPDTLVLTMESEGDEVGIFNAEADRQRQQLNGYRYTDKELCHVSIEEFPPLSRIPLPKEVDLSFEEFLHIAQHVHVSERQPRPPETYVCDPFVMVKAALMALNMEMLIKRVPSLLGDAKLQILEADNMKPILDFIGNHKSCTEAVKEATLNALLSLFAVELMTREQPEEIRTILESPKVKDLKLLDG